MDRDGGMNDDDERKRRDKDEEPVLSSIVTAWKKSGELDDENKGKESSQILECLRERDTEGERVEYGAEDLRNRASGQLLAPSKKRCIPSSLFSRRSFRPRIPLTHALPSHCSCSSSFHVSRRGAPARA